MVVHSNEKPPADLSQDERVFLTRLSLLDEVSQARILNMIEPGENLTTTPCAFEQHAL